MIEKPFKMWIIGIFLSPGSIFAWTFNTLICIYIYYFQNNLCGRLKESKSPLFATPFELRPFWCEPPRRSFYPQRRPGGGGGEWRSKGMLTHPSDSLAQIVFPMDEDAVTPIPVCSAPPQSEPAPPFLPLSYITPRYSFCGTFLLVLRLHLHVLLLFLFLNSWFWNYKHVYFNHMNLVFWAEDSFGNKKKHFT